jgi:hypothetical protein
MVPDVGEGGGEVDDKIPAEEGCAAVVRHVAWDGISEIGVF